MRPGSPRWAFYLAFRDLVTLSQANACTRKPRLQRQHVRNLRSFHGTSRRYTVPSLKTADDVPPEDADDFPDASRAQQDMDGRSTAESVRRLMRGVAHPVSVITVFAKEGDRKTTSTPPKPRHANLSPYYKNFCGATVSSLSTVTLGPPAVVAFNLKRPSRTLDGILEHGRFVAHFPQSNPSGRWIAKAFAKFADNHDPFEQIARLPKLNVGYTNVDPGESGSSSEVLPLLHGDGISARFHCKLLRGKCIEIGDHTLVVAEITDATPGILREVNGVDDSNVEGNAHQAATLSYWNGHYCSVENGSVLQDDPVALRDSDS